MRVLALTQNAHHLHEVQNLGTGFYKGYARGYA